MLLRSQPRPATPPVNLGALVFSPHARTRPLPQAIAWTTSSGRCRLLWRSAGLRDQERERPEVMERARELLRQSGWGPPLEGGSPSVPVPDQRHDVELGRSTAESKQGHEPLIVDADLHRAFPPGSRLQSPGTGIALAQLAEKTTGKVVGTHGSESWRSAVDEPASPPFEGARRPISKRCRLSRVAPIVQLSPQEEEALQHLVRRCSAECRLVQRAEIILHAAAGESNVQIARCLDLSSRTVGEWRRRYLARRQQSPDKPVARWLADADRLGCPPTFDEFFWIDVLALATSDPEDSKRPITHWTTRELAAEVVERDMAETIHYSTISRFLRSCDLQPHRVVEWMNRKADPDFDAQAREVKEVLVEGQSDSSGERVAVSFDEKTGMQAKQRIASSLPVQPGRPARQEFEYQRHGTLVLFAMMVVHSGQILTRLRPNRTNPVTAAVLAGLFADLLRQGYQQIDIVLDQLNTHWSADLVKAVAKLCGLPEPLPEEICTGAQRRTWLKNPDKAIVFHFTPKHASWLNPIEIWFGVLARKVLRRGSFCSTADLEAKVERFVDYFNEKLAHPYKLNTWKVAA